MDKEKKVVELNIDDILPNRFQPRIKFDENAILDLSTSIKEHGVIQPLVVRKIGDKYEIIAGERRYKASVMAGLKTVPAIITDLNDKDSAEVALIENVQRQNLTPIEEAVSYKKILDMGYITQEQLANKLGKSQSSIANKLRLLNLDDDVQEALLNGQISERHARSLLKLNKLEDQRYLLNRIIDERLTVRKTDEEIEKMFNNSDNTENNEKINESINNFFEEPKEEVEEIEKTDPLNFDFSSPMQNEFSENLFDMSNNNESTDFFGFSQNIEDDASYTNDFINIDKIENEAQDLYPKEEKKDINSFLEPTLLINDDTDTIEKQDTNNSSNFNPFDSDLFEMPNQDDNVSIDNSNNVVNDFDFEPKENRFDNVTNSYFMDALDTEKNVLEKEDSINNLFMNQDDNMNFDNQENNIAVDNQENNNTFDLNQTFDNQFNFDNEDVTEMKSGKFFNIFNNVESQELSEEKEDESKELTNVTSNIDYASIFEQNDLKPIVPQKIEETSFNEENQKEPIKSTDNVNLAIEKIRMYAEELKKLGVDMNIEETDFENKYQVTINIDK